jgi:dihydrofolate reductase
MRKVILYIAMSLDGLIADQDGGVGFLCGDGSEPDHPGSYPSFIESVDTIILGYHTYYQLITELAPDDWVYHGKTTYVMTNRELTSNDEVIFTHQPLVDLLVDLKSQSGKNIWICGGASIVNQALDVLDQLWITVIPIVLGDGIRLFDLHAQSIPLRLVATNQYNGMIDLVYEKRLSE